jgi:Spy/CpxP family protein refolding chaperone
MSVDREAKALRPKAAAGLLLLLVFVVGGLAGAAVDRFVLRPPPAVAADAAPAATVPAPDRSPRRRSREAYVRQLQEELALTPDQVAKIDVITKEREARMKALLAEVRPRFRSLVEETRGEIDKVLSPEQQAKLKELRAREHKEHRRDRPPSP